jgi:sugar phosphate isomerase/epimerase
MRSRREFLSSLAAGLGAAALVPRLGTAADKAAIKTALNGPIGLQLWSLREQLKQDVPGTLARIRAMGFTEVEGAGLWGRSAAELRAALDAASLRCQSAHMGFERLRDDAAGAMAEAKALGASWVVCPWIPHEAGRFGLEDARKAAEAFNRFGASAREAGLRFAYHCHGYEFVPAEGGLLWDRLVGATDPELVAFQIDVFHCYNGGGDPARTIRELKGRVPSLHLKDLKKAVAVKAGAATAEPEVDVPVGSGQIDWPEVLKAAMAGGTSLYYVEDESRDPLGHIPQSVEYLERLKL